MIEIGLFVIIVGIITTLIAWFFNLTWLDPWVILVLMTILILPGIYAAITSGPYVPSARKRHQSMLDLADIKKTDIVYDLGCGDGRLVFSASKYAKKAIGFELSIPLVIYGKLASLFYPKSKIKFGNIWKQDYQDADVIFCYLLPKAMKQFYTEVWPKLKPGTRVISNAFMMKEIKPLQKEEKVYLYVKD